MQINGFAKTTLLDYPGHLAATIFTGSCNFRCPFCHNGDLVLHPEAQPVISQEEVLSYLKKRQGILEGICITGGEPTLQPGLSEFIRAVRLLGYQVKLDTNGYRPDVLKELVEEGLLDYVAMDIKNCPEKYGVTAGLPCLDLDQIRASVSFLQKGSLPFEFRTTVVKELHSLEDMAEIGAWIQGAPVYYLQSYRESSQVIKPVFSPCSDKTLSAMREMLLEYIPNVTLRGID